MCADPEDHARSSAGTEGTLPALEKLQVLERALN